MTQCMVKMLAGQVRQIKPRRLFFMNTSAFDEDDSLWEMVVSDNKAWRINVKSGFTHELGDYRVLFEDYSSLVEGLADNHEVFVDASVYTAWKNWSKL